MKSSAIFFLFLAYFLCYKQNMKYELKVYISKLVKGEAKYTSYLYTIEAEGETKEDAIKNVLSKNLRELDLLA